jgi:hypothetical protein
MLLTQISPSTADKKANSNASAPFHRSLVFNPNRGHVPFWKQWCAEQSNTSGVREKMYKPND